MFMRNQTVINKDLNKLISALIKAYSSSIQSDPEPDLPFFMTGLQARIRERQNIAQFWETGIIKAQKWLVALSLIALIFFVSNIVFNPSMTASQDFSLETLALDHEWDHLTEDTLQLSEPTKN